MKAQRLTDEERALRKAAAIGAQYGYSNVIDRLMSEWKTALMSSGLSDEVALEVTIGHSKRDSFPLKAAAVKG